MPSQTSNIASVAKPATSLGHGHGNGSNGVYCVVI
ncbi:hypothetical protein L249_1875 [Ophiocordyceps polyrhachis-furcata BCC 54312]|uniref:Uncharacterized protein n=1 Tax=Ophiocordyceps polyrhachis-furcata BCC 54312 TaxID=1330021 RepID=A0A367LP41_9HYPO|nr:hypothetical protein L249_1875 [Ophiocordyceps polyrhachis-furcata BCC 54312]